MKSLRHPKYSGLVIFVSTALAILVPVNAATAKNVNALAKSEQRGQKLADTLCSRCHSITKTGRSKNSKAPAFRLLSKRYPLQHLEEALAEGIVVGHKGAAMPEFSFTPDQIEDFIAFVKAISKK